METKEVYEAMDEAITFVRDVKVEEDKLNNFRKQRDNELYNKIGIRGK